MITILQYLVIDMHLNHLMLAMSRVLKTGIKEVDDCLNVMGFHYYGIYCVSLANDKGKQILAPANYFSLSNEEYKFSEVLKQYIYDYIKSGNNINFDIDLKSMYTENEKEIQKNLTEKPQIKLAFTEVLR